MFELIIVTVLILTSRFFPTSSEKHSVFFIVSEQSDVEVLINDSPTGFCAPCPILVPRNQAFKLTLRKPGFEDSICQLICLEAKCYTHINMRRKALKLVL